MSAHRFSTYEAKASLSKLVDVAAAGEDSVLVQDGLPVARPIAYNKPHPPWNGRGFGSDPELVVPDDFDDPLPDGVLASMLS